MTPLAMDLDQWRRDIKTFLETTENAIEAIVGQLSNRCSTDFSDQIGHAQYEDSRSFVGSSSNQNKLAIPARNQDDSQDQLRELKSILTQRISQRK